MKKIKLSQNQFTIVDDEDFDWLDQWKWCVAWCSHTKGFYAIRSIWINNKVKTVRMARFILNAKKGEVIDHKNHDTLDNRRENLRPCTPRENSMNSRPRENSRGKYKGISFNKGMKKWQAQIRVNNKLINLAYSKDKKVVARAYDIAALNYFGEFAHLNNV